MINIKSNFKYIFSEETIKILILAICFFITTGSYTLIKEIKDTIFMVKIGKEYIPDVKTLAFLFIIPLAFFYSFIASRFKKHLVLIIFTFLYSIIGLIFSFILKGIIIKDVISYNEKLIIWIFYLFFEGYMAFVVGSLWAFLNFISFPSDLKNNYMKMTIAFKIGCLFFPLIGLLILKKNILLATTSITILKLIFLSNLLIPILIIFMKKNLNPNIFVGYTMESIDSTNKKKFGISVFFKHSYVFCIFGLSFLWEVTNVIFNYMRLGIALEGTNNINEVLIFLFKDALFSNIIGLIFVVFGTSIIVRYFSLKIALCLVPIMTGLSIIFYLLFPQKNILIIVNMILRAIHFSFAKPLNESLYIPTTSEIKFQSKSFIESIGSKISKGIGSTYNKLIQFFNPAILFNVHITFFLIITFLWILDSYYLGKYWEKIVKDKKIIK
jgi:AAA family ATP:ADP antiporter